MKTPLSFDWAGMIRAMLQHGVPRQDIAGGALNERMLHHYQRGAQPMHWRGELILAQWCKAFGKPRSDAPTMTLTTHRHRVDRRLQPEEGPRVQSLPQWPPAPQPAVKPRKKPGPKPKARVEA